METVSSTISRKEIIKAAMILAVPMMIQNGISNAVGLVDNIMVGSLGTESITAVSIALQIIFVYTLALFGGLSGPGIYGAQYYGSGNIEGVRNIFRIKWWIAMVILAGGAFVIFVFGDSILAMYLQGESASIDADLTLSLAREYLHIMFIGLIPLSISFIYAGSLRETGDSVKPMVAGICSVTTDIVFNYLLIFGNLGFPQLGIRGAAIATVLGRVLELIVIIAWSHAKRNKHTFLIGVYRTLKIPMDMFKRVLIKGLPIFVNELLWSAGLAILTQCYSLRGLNVVAGLNISNAICNLLNVGFICLGSAVGILCGQMLGAGRFDNAKKSSVTLTWFSALISLGLTGILLLISGPFPDMYNTTGDVRDYARMFIIITAAFFPVQGILNALYFTLRSGGKTIITFLFDSVYSWGVSVPLAFALVLNTDLNVLIIYGIIQAIDIIKIFIGIVLVKKGIWITNLANAIKD